MQSLKKAKIILSIGFMVIMPMLVQSQSNLEFSLEEKLVVTDSFKNFIELIVAKAKQNNGVDSLSEPLCNCYERIAQGKSRLLIKDLVGAYPQLMQEFQDLVHMTRAPRPGGGVVNPPVGPIISCNVKEISDILNRVSNIFNFCCAQLQQDFEFTWTFIEEIQDSLNATTTLGILNTLTECCANITNNFISTWTILADIEQTIIVDFNGVFTAIQDINDNLSSVTVFVDFSPVFTVLADIQETITFNFDGTFTALEDIKNTITECCPDFEGTFTVLLDIQNTITINFDGTFTVLEEILNNGSSDTFTVLEDIINTITINFDGTFTVLQDIKNTLTECCADMQQNFEDTWTILAEINTTLTTNFDGTFTVIASFVFSGSVIADLTDIYTVLNAGFDGTFTALADLENSFTSVSFLGTFTMLEELNACFATSLTGAANLTSSGYYCLANDVVGSFTITANNVVLDLNNHNISTGGIFILTGTNRTVKNGRLNSSTGGIAMTANNNTTLEYLSIVNPTTIAITSTGSAADNTIRYVTIENGTGGIACVNDTNVRITDVSINTMSSFGMSFTANSNLSIDKVSILNTGSDGIDMTNPVHAQVNDVTIYNAALAGVITYGTTSRCFFENIEVTNANMQYGISLDTASNCQINNCSIANLGSTAFANATIGIHIGPNAASGAQNIVNGCSVKNINSTAGPTGIFVRSTSSDVIDCTVQSIVGAAGDACGYRITGSNTSCINCSANTITNSGAANNGSAYGFRFAADAVQAINCTALSITINAIPNTVAGFGIFDINNACYRCSVSNINCTVSEGTATLAGFLIDGAGDNALLKNCSVMDVASHGYSVSGSSVFLFKCLATRSSTNGFNIITSSLVSLAECTSIANNNGIVLPAVNSNPVFHCYAGNNTTSNFVNLPAGTIQLPTGSPELAGANVRRTAP